MKQLFFALSCLLLESLSVRAGQMSLLGAGVTAGGAPPPSYTGPGDIVTGASAWWGLRAYNTAYATALGNIADIVDTATGASSCTMVAKATGDADLTSNSCSGGTESVTHFCTVTHAGCSITQLYDQTGNARHLQNATVANCPTLLLGSVTGLASNRPAMLFTSANSQKFVSALLGAIPQPLTQTAVANRSGTAAGALVATDVGSNSELRLDTAGTILIFSGGTPVTQTETDGAWHSFAGVFTTTGVSSFVSVDGVSGTVGSVGTNGMNSGHFTMGDQAFGSFMNGNVQEGGVWPSTLTGTQISNLYNGTGGAKPYWGF